MRRMLWFWAIVAIGMLPLTGCAGTGEWTSHFVMEGVSDTSSSRRATRWSSRGAALS